MPGAIRMRPRRSLRVAACGREDGQPGEHEVDLGDRARRPDVVGPPEQARADRDGIGQPGEEALRVDAGDNGTRRDLLASGEHDTRRPAVTRGDRADLGVGPDLDAGFARGRLEGRRQGARATAGEDRLAGRSPVVARRVREQHGGRARRPRPHRGVLDTTPGDRRLERIGLERFGHEIGDRHRQDAGDRPAVVAPEATERPPELEPGEGVAQTGRFDVGRRPAGDLAEEARQRADEAVERRVRVGVGSRTGTEPLRGPGDVAPQHDRVAVQARCEGPHLRPDQRQPVALQVEVADDRRPQPPDRVGQRRHAGARRQLGGRRGPADGRSSLQDDRSQPGLAEVGRRHQAVVSAPDDDRVVAVRLARARHARPPSGRGPAGPRARRSGRWRP